MTIRPLNYRQFLSASRRTHRTAIAMVALVALLTGGCASMKKDSNELPVPPQRLTLAGYSFMPPAEKEWFIAERGADYIVLAKAGKYLGQTLTIQSERVPLPATPATLMLVNHVRTTDAQGLVPPRYRIRAHDAVPASVGNASCVISNLEVEDREPAATSGPIVALLVQTASVTCRDAARPDTGIKLSYSHRAYPEDRDPAFQARAEPVINSLQIAPQTQR